MTDKRELIIARLSAIVNDVDGLETFERNRTEFDDTQLPAGSVLEGDEEVDPDDLPLTRPSARPYQITALPQVFIRVATDNDNAGTNLNIIRGRVLKAVLEDAELNALSVNGRNVRPVAQQSNLHAARNMLGAMAITFAIKYVFHPSDIEI